MTVTQKQLLDLLEEIDYICVKYDIEYYLGGGSLIGAVRHGGFLPWDDDADIHMSRENADKFVEAVKNENIPGRIVYTEAENGDYGNAHWRYQNVKTTTLLRSLIGATCEQGQFVDIFINYPLPKDEKEKQRCLEAYEVYSELKAQNSTITSVNRTEEFLREYHAAKHLEKKVGKKRVLEHYEKELFFFPEEETEDWFLRAPYPPKRVTPKEWWGTPRRVEFENLKLPVAEYSEKLLCYEYGPTWYEVPVQVERGEHTFVADFELPYNVYTAEYGKYLNIKEFYDFEVEKKEYWFSILKDRNVVNPHIHKLRGKQVVLEIKQRVEEYGINLKRLVSEGQKRELSVIFKPYFDYLNVDTSRYWGLYVDMPDDYFYAAFYFSCFDGNYGLARKVLAKRRELETRELSEELAVLCEICDATDEMLTMLYGELDYDAAEKLVEKWLEKHPNLLYFMRAKMYLDLRKITADNEEQLLKQCERYLELYEKDGELLKYKGDLLMRMERMNEAEKCYRMALNTLKNGYCITEIKKYFESKVAEV